MGIGSHAWAVERQASVGFYDQSLEPVVMRLRYELASDGYSVRVEALQMDPDCSASASDRSNAASAEVERVWIRVGRVKGDPNTGCAAVTYVRPGSEVRTAHITSPDGDINRFALTVAEALNGLSSQAPPRSGNVVAAPPVVAALAPVEQPASDILFRSSFGASAHLLLDAQHPQPLLALGILAELPLGSRLSLLLDNLWALTPLRLSEAQTELTARFTWTRVCLAVEVLGEPENPLNWQLFGGGGPAFTWVTADVPPSAIARADVGTSMLFSVGSTVSVRGNAPVHAAFTLRASSLLPAVRFQMPSGPSSPFGHLVGEAGVALLADF